MVEDLDEVVAGSPDAPSAQILQQLRTSLEFKIATVLNSCVVLAQVAAKLGGYGLTNVHFQWERRRQRLVKVLRVQVW